MGIRSVLSSILSSLSKWAIVKHGMKCIVVAGDHGTKLTGELIAEMLAPDYIVRRQLERPFWDYSIPLTILGFEDRHYSPIEWIIVIVKATLMLIFGRKNFTWTILQMSTYKTEIASYWSKILDPEVLVLVNSSPKVRDLETLLIKKTRRLVVIPENIRDHPAVKKSLPSEVVIVGEGKDSDLRIEKIEDHEQGITVYAKWIPHNDKVKFFAFQRGAFIKEPLVLALGVLLGMDFSVEEVSDRLLQSEINVERFIFTAP